MVSVIDANTIKYQPMRGGLADLVSPQEPVTARLFGLDMPSSVTGAGLASLGRCHRPEAYCWQIGAASVETRLEPQALAELKRRVEGEIVEIQRTKWYVGYRWVSFPEGVVIVRGELNVNRSLVEEGFALIWPAGASAFETGDLSQLTLVPPGAAIATNSADVVHINEWLTEWSELERQARSQARGLWRERCADATTRFPESVDPPMPLSQASPSNSWFGLVFRGPVRWPRLSSCPSTRGEQTR